MRGRNSLQILGRPPNRISDAGKNVDRSCSLELIAYFELEAELGAATIRSAMSLRNLGERSRFGPPE